LGFMLEFVLEENSVRLIFMGTPEFAVPSLERLIHAQHQVVAVYTQPDREAGRGRPLVLSPVKKVALARGLPLMQPARLSPEEKERLAALHPDVIVVAAFGQILPPAVLDIPPLGCINIHPSLLPRHRGPSPAAAAILAGEELTGVTIMLMERGLDKGPVLAKAPAIISPQDTAGSLTLKLAEAGAELLAETLPRWQGGELVPQPQDEEKATYSKLTAKGEGEIDWHLAAVSIWRRVRAFQPWPGCYTRWRGKLLKILEATPLPGEGGLVPGRVIAVRYAGGEPEPGGAVVGVETGRGVLGLLWVQLEGRRAISAAEFIRGQRDFLGAELSSPR
jgi:methionyl-tRNA formyltransferase